MAKYQSNQTTCKRGHEFTPENTRLDLKGNRHCKLCAALAQNEKKSKTPYVKDRKGTGKRVYCKNGHELTIENSYIQKSGARLCKKCHITRVIAYQQRKKRDID